jgi:hypothetical protein
VSTKDIECLGSRAEQLRLVSDSTDAQYTPTQHLFEMQRSRMLDGLHDNMGLTWRREGCFKNFFTTEAFARNWECLSTCGPMTRDLWRRRRHEGKTMSERQCSPPLR